MVSSDIAKIVGVAHGFSMLFEMDLLSSIFVAAAVAVLLPIFVSFLGYDKLMMLCLSISTFTSVFYALGIYQSHAEASFTTHDMYSGVNLKNACIVMTLLGAQIMPHNFYMHPCLAQQKREIIVSKSLVIQTHLFAIASIFTSVFLVNSAMINSAASVFNAYGFAMPFFDDAFLLMDQIFTGSVVMYRFCLCFFLSSLVAAVTHGHVGQVIAHDYFHIDLPIWLYQIISKAFVVVPVLHCIEGAGAEGIYQLLLYCQIVSAVLLPLSVVPLFQLSSSHLIMGDFRISPFVKFLCMTSFTGMLAVIGIFIMELLFGNNGWSIDLTGDMGYNFTNFYSFFVLLAIVSLSFTLTLFFTPLRSSLNEPQTKRLESRVENDSAVLLDTIHHYSVAQINDRSSLDFQHEGSFFESSSRDTEKNIKYVQGLPEFCIASTPTTARTSCRMEAFVDDTFSGDADITSLLTDSAGKHAIPKSGVTPEGVRPSSSALPEFSNNSDSKVNECSESSLFDKKADMEGKEPTFELGRRGRRQLATTLNEFWGLLFDCHGKLTKEAENIRAAILLGLECPLPSASTDSRIARESLSLNGRVEEIDPSLSSVPGPYRKSLLTQDILGAQSPCAMPTGPPFLSPAVQYCWPTIQGSEAQSGYERFCVQTICSSLKPLKLDSKTEGVPLALADDSQSQRNEDGISKSVHFILGHEMFWTKDHFIPSVNLIGRDNGVYSPFATLTWGGKIIQSASGAPKIFLTYGESERLVLWSFRFCIRELLRLDGSSWLFSQNGGPDEELIDCLAMTEEDIQKDVPCEVHENLRVFIPNLSCCSKDCIWQANLLTSFGVWCIHRILELLILETRPELWGKYTYVLNRLQGILDPAFGKKRKSLSRCECLQACHHDSRVNSGKARLTSRSSILQLVKRAEGLIQRRKGPSGTRAGEIAFPRGKENIISVLRRYKQKLTALN